jgi:FkbM family methyltransferase
MERYQAHNLFKASANTNTPYLGMLPYPNRENDSPAPQGEPSGSPQCCFKEDSASREKLIRLFRAFDPKEIHILGAITLPEKKNLTRALRLAALKEHEFDLTEDALEGICQVKEKTLILVQPFFKVTEHILTKLHDQTPGCPAKQRLVIFTGCFFCSDQFTLKTVQGSFHSNMLPRLNPLYCQDLSAAPYWEAGFFMGGLSTAPLLKKANQGKIALIFEPGLNFAGFFNGKAAQKSSPDSPDVTEKTTLDWTHNPTQSILDANENNVPAVRSARQGVRLFAENNLEKATQAFYDAQRSDPVLPGINLALAICLARQKDYTQAWEMLEREKSNHPIRQSLSEFLQQIAPETSANQPLFHEPENARMATLFAEHKILVDKRALHMGGSWTNEKGEPQAYEKELIAFFHDQAQTCTDPIILDIGSNTGSFCLLPAFNPKMRAFAFEPQPLVRKVLEANVSLNRLQDRVKISSLALAHEKGECVLKQPTDQSNTGLACLGSPVRFDEWNEITVPVSTLDQACLKLGIPRADLLKIDTEGCELFVLLGGEEFIKTWQPGILVEYYASNTAQFGYKPEKIVELLDSWGYKKLIKVSDSDLFFPSPARYGQGS